MGLTRTRFSQANTAIAKIQDPITVLNSESTVANVDVGFLINRNQGIKSNVAIFWREDQSEFTLALTSNTGVIDSNILVASYANLKAGTVYANIGNASDNSNVYINSSLIPSANVSYDLGTYNNRFRDIWLSGNTLHIGSENLNISDGNWNFTTNGETVTLGSGSTFNNIIVSNITVTTNLTVQGTRFISNSVDVAFTDSVIELHTQSNLAPLTTDDGRDIGLKFHYFKTQDEHAFLGWSNNSGYLEWYDSGREGVGNIFSGNTYGTIKSGGAWLVNTTPSTSTTTGALRVAGGVGIAGNLYLNTTGDVSANIGYVRTTLLTLDANVGNYQAWANANAASQENSITTLNSNAASQQVSINNLSANVEAYQLYANANIGYITNEISSIISGANANTAAYLLTSTGNISAGNIISSGNIYGGLVPTAIFKSIYIGTSLVDLARSAGQLTVDNFNTTGYAWQSNLADLATNATKTTVTSNIISGTSYITFVSATSGNVDQYVNTALTYDPNTGNLKSYAGYVVTDITAGGNIYITNGIRWSGNGDAFVTSLYSNANVASYLPVDSTIVAIQANLGSYQTYANANVVAIQANLGAYQTYANANVVAIQANLGAYQTYANNSVNDIKANLGAYQTYANANVVAIQANLGAYQTYANASIDSLYTGANANTAAYLTSYTGNVQAGNIAVTGNINVASNVFANVYYTVNGIRWAGNGAVFQSGGGGGGNGIPIDFGLITEVASPTSNVDFGTLV